VNKKFFIAWPLIFVLWMIGSFLVHGTLLQAEYSKLPHMFRQGADAEQYLPFMILAHIILSGAFVWIYSRGAEAKPWLAQGLRFGGAVALLTIVPSYIIYYAVQPMPGTLVLRQIVLDGILLLILGAAVSFLHRGAASD